MYSIHPVPTDKHLQVVDFVCREFVATSVLHQALGIPLAEYQSYMTEPVCSLLKQGLSFVALDATDGSVIGCILAGEYPQSPEWTNSVAGDETPEFIKPVEALLLSLIHI